ncbi:hypothetical protein VNO78_06255 [Psophocarpus tetragonolobus]|uniref:Uncharacterized protein n=1 Tax=Psophocarpus tetragonolobus TaxID=3891 RepID=A0AAN9T1Q6_PSOTE
MEASKKKGVTIKKKINDHWAFLEHIQAPMWVDLTLEVKSGGVDTGDDDWFNTSHLFHQMSARELKSKFSRGEEILTSEVDLHGVNSPELPSSVSRSRGKHYNSKKWEGIDLNTSLDKQKGFSKRDFQQGSSFGQEVKPKSISNVIRLKGLSSGKLGLASERHAKGKTDSKAICSNPVSNSSSDLKTGESSARSVITSENTQEVSSQPYDQKRSSSIRIVSLGKSRVTGKVSRIQAQKKYVEVSSLPFDQKNRTSSSDHKSGGSTGRSTISSENTQKCREVSSKPCNQKRSSPIRRVSLRKSCVTRKVSSILPQKKCLEVSSQPCDQKSRGSSIISVRRSYVSGESSKVENGGDSMRSRRRKSSSGKSNVGSCSNPSYEVKFVSMRRREKITDEKGEITMNLAVKNLCKTGEISKTSTILVEKANYGSREGSSISFLKPAYRRAAKSLVQYPSTSSRALLQYSVNKEKNCTGDAKEKLGTIKVNSLPGKGKENATRNLTVRKKCPARGVSAGEHIKRDRTTEHSHPHNRDTAGSTALTIVVL